MDEGTYQLIASGTIALTGIVANTYLNNQRKRMINYFINRFTEKIKIINKLNKGLENLAQNGNN